MKRKVTGIVLMILSSLYILSALAEIILPPVVEKVFLWAGVLCIFALGFALLAEQKNA